MARFKVFWTYTQGGSVEVEAADEDAAERAFRDTDLGAAVMDGEVEIAEIEEAGAAPPVPPKDDWPVFRVNVRSIDVQEITVRAPDAKRAKERVQEYLDDGTNDCQDLRMVEDAGWFEVGQDPPETLPKEHRPAIEWAPEPTRGS